VPMPCPVHSVPCPCHASTVLFLSNSNAIVVDSCQHGYLWEECDNCMWALTYSRRRRFSKGKILD
jgi:hypothetical protein